LILRLPLFDGRLESFSGLERRLGNPLLDAWGDSSYFSALPAGILLNFFDQTIMNIHEYQAKQLFDKFGVPSPQGRVASTAEEAKAAAEAIGGDNLVVKAQVHAGGRGKGTFKNGFQGGVHICKTPAEIGEIAGKMLNQVLVTHQTGEEGKLVRKVMVAEAVDISKEFYLAILMDRDRRCPVIVASTEGGMDIEEVAASTPEKIVSEYIHPLAGLQAYEVRKLCATLGLSGAPAKQFSKLLTALYKLFLDCDCSMVEINPLVVTPDDKVLALDAKFGFDDNALYRQPEIMEMYDPEEDDPREVEAAKFNLSYIGLDGNIACLVNGAGLAMATMDIIKHYGGDPANFLDVGGGATKEQVAAAFKIILSDPKVKGILVNIFGGIMQCDIIAEGVLAAVKETGLNIPLVVRLEGTNVAEGKKLIAESDLNVISAEDLDDAAKKVVAAIA
jgi:succinyl-CoA synthetase beta subunit